MPVSLTKVCALGVPIVLLVLTALAGYVHSQSRHLSLPIPTALTIFTLFLPLASYITTHLATPALRKRNLSTSLLAILIAQLIYETIIVTLAATYVVPSPNLSCGLDSRWRVLYSKRDARSIRRIQDAFDCCGLNSLRDRAWPFKNNAREDGNCVDMFHRQRSCAKDWRSAERGTAGLVLIVALGVFIVKLLSIVVVMSNSSMGGKHGLFRWQATPDEEESEEARRASMRRLIENGSASAEPYNDDDRVSGSHNTENNDLEPRVQPSTLTENGREWRDI